VTFSSDDRIRRPNVQRLFTFELLEPQVLFLQRLQPPHLADAKAAKLRLPALQRLAACAVLATMLGAGDRPRLFLGQDADDRFI
jgi:hypothetical protein